MKSEAKQSTMSVADHMSPRVVTADPQMPVADAKALFAKHRIRQLPVLRRDRVVGIITDRDVRSSRDPKRKVADAMTAKPLVISPHASVDEAARLLRTYKIGALPVVDGGKLVGILTGSDVLDAFVELSGVAEPSYRLTVSGQADDGAEPVIRRVVEQIHGELKWLHRVRRGQRSEIQARLKARRIDDVVTKLEAAGLEVSSVVASPRTQ